MTSIRWWVFKIVLGGAKQLAGAKAKIKEILKYKKYGNMTLYKDLKRQELLEDEWFSTFFGSLYFHGKSKKIQICCAMFALLKILKCRKY